MEGLSNGLNLKSIRRKNIFKCENNVKSFTTRRQFTVIQISAFY